MKQLRQNSILDDIIFNLVIFIKELNNLNNIYLL